jgi:hypothetical protein
VGTYAFSINAAGAITGYYEVVSGVDHGFARAVDGSITTFDPAGSIFTIPYSINDAGAITGYYSYAPTNHELEFHGFLVTQPAPIFAGTPGYSNCHGESVAALAGQYGGLNAAVAAFGFSSVTALHNAILAFCGA